MINSSTRGFLADRHRFEPEPIDLNRSGSVMSSLILWEVTVEGYQDSLLKLLTSWQLQKLMLRVVLIVFFKALSLAE